APTFAAQDATLASVAALLNDQPFTGGTTVAVEGTYSLAVTATDRAGNSARKQVSFTIVKTAPTLSISGVSDGAFTNQDIHPVLTALDANLVGVVATLDGQAFASGSAVTAEGAHELSATALDRAGNRADQRVAFTIDKSPPEIQVSGVADG